MAQFKNTARVRKFCLMRINQHHGIDVLKNSSGHKKIAQELVSLGWMEESRAIGQKRASQLMHQYYAQENGSKVKMPVKKKKKREPSKQKAFLTSWEWRTLRYKIINKHGRRCMCCGANPDDGHTVIHVDHIKPRHTHPELSLTEDNLQVLCGVCNQGKGAWDTTDFRDNKTEYEEHIDNVIQIELARKAKESQ